MLQENNSQTVDQLSDSTTITLVNQQETHFNPLKMGAEYAGGIIVDLDETGLHGLACAPHDQGVFEWGNVGLDFPNFPEMIGDGALNTQRILEYCDKRPIAASVCADLVLNGYSDWYLPSIGELFKVMRYLNFSHSITENSDVGRNYSSSLPLIVNLYDFGKYCSSSPALILSNEVPEMGVWVCPVWMHKGSNWDIYSTEYVTTKPFRVRAVRRF